MPEKLVLLNDLCPEIDKEQNGPFYDQETQDTGVVYRILNVVNGKSYIGRACSYYLSGGRHGAKDRFKEHWSAKSSETKKSKDCPIFYPALRGSHIHDWFVFVLKVCSKEYLKEWETKLIEEYNTCDPKFGYNVFVGNNKPNNEAYLKKYQLKKVETNTQRAIGSKSKRIERNKNLPTYISYYCTKNNGKLVNEGYLVRIKINQISYVKRFLSMNESMKEKLDKAKKQLEIFKQEAKNENNIPKPKKEKKILPRNISYIADKNGVGNFVEGYLVRIKINGKQYQKKFLSMTESMKAKLKKAKKQVELFKKEAMNNKISGSKTANKLVINN